MTFDTLLTVALDAAFVAVFALSLVDWIRHRGAVRRAIMLVFASTAIVLGVPLLTGLVPALRGALNALVVPALFAQPLLVLWLVSYVRTVPRVLLWAAFLAFLAVSAGLFWLAGTNVEPRSPAVIAFALAALGYFAVVAGAAAVGFLLAAREPRGRRRTRARP